MIHRAILIACLVMALAPASARCQCGPDGSPPCMTDASETTDCCQAIDLVSSYDPNDKRGPAGFGLQRSLAPGAFMPYTIYFENLPAATAPAQEVRVTDLLDPAVFELATFAFAAVGFGDTSLAAPPGASSFSVDIDRRPAQNLIVRFEGSLNPQTGAMACRFRSLDPITLDPLDDPDGGFLPPNLNAPQGEGFVTYVLRAKSSLATGTRIANTAHIVFDVNPPIDTPEWFNTVDADRPIAHVDPLPPLVSRSDFGVSWAGTDVGSGLRDYTIYVSDDGGPYAPWLTTTPAQTDTFPGELGHVYRFYALSRDSVGNLEPVPNQPDATTSVDSTTAALPTLVDARSDGARVRVLWFAADRPQGAAIERRTEATPWNELGVPAEIGRGYLEYTDSTAVAGERYGYRLRLPRAQGFAYFGEVWIETNALTDLALGLSGPNPSRNPIMVNFSLPGPGSALLELFDVGGRRIFARQLSDLGPGSHRYPISEVGSLAAGGYLLRLSHGGRSLMRKVVVIP